MNVQKTFTILLLSSLVVADLAMADRAGPLLTLPEAIALAIADNDRIEIADADVALAGAGMEDARSPRLPRIDLTETVSVSTNPATVFAQLLGQEAFTVDDFAVDRLNNPDALSNFNTKLSLTQSIWTGGRIKSGAEASRLVVGARERDRERVRQAVVRDVIAAYTGAVLAGNELQVASDARASARANVGLIEDLFDAGLVVESDLLQARVRETEMRELVVRAESGLEVAYATVNHVLGRDLSIVFRLSESLDAGNAVERPLTELIETALDNRPDLHAAELQLQAAEQEVRRARAGDRFDVGVSGMLEANDADFIGADGTNWSVFLGANFRVFDGHSRRSSVRQAEALSTRARSMNALLQRSVELQVRRASAELRAARLRLEQTESATSMARASLRIVRDRYREGLTTLVELLETETALTRARARGVRAQRDALLAAADLDLAVGRL